MRRVAFLLVTATLAATTSLPAAAIKKTVRVPFLDCEVSVETNDVSIVVNHRGVHVQRHGDVNTVGTTC